MLTLAVICGLGYKNLKNLHHKIAYRWTAPPLLGAFGLMVFDCVIWFIGPFAVLLLIDPSMIPPV